ncbi:LysM peptidoglycan-binding domain-containing protein [Facklamia sp. 7083-14-GEN3]|uniref:LysM peptidoglycan-binding domain-containing protein n=1 Tax=Facklamia sp. 7083-14-GEN3 TaxID=2973478 RepID=UPI00215C14F0|nr:LysM peptidoglycan-binding domain-containing protein [Facklamia sp. 7083-14-GEN3]MCR8969223.1 LysM peptidoglycan-binding domain-containing protein [Facklamia sp. 7083-14-GEN3]
MIQQRNQRMRQQEKIQRRKLFKKIFTNINVGAMLLSTSVLTQVQSENAIVHAQKSQKKFSPQEFINSIGQSAKEIAAKNDLYASVMIAQAALESGWGSSTLSQAPNYNLFGVKAGKNDKKVEMDTLEDDGTGSYYQIKDHFRKYDSYADSLMDYARVLTGEGSAWRKSYYQGALKSNTTSYQDATKHLTGRYATDTRYGGKLNQIISQYQLDQFDGSSHSNQSSTVKPSAPLEIEEPTIPSGIVSTESSTRGNYKVQAGDGFYRIAKKLGVKVDDLLKANGMTIQSVIHPNQVLRVPGQTQSNSQVNKPSISKPFENASNPVKKDTVSSTTKGLYTIKAGDSLYVIAKKHGVRINDLLVANGIRLTTVIHPNQQLKIPGGHKVDTPSLPVNKKPVSTPKENPVVTEKPQETAQKTSGNYTVKAGDSLWAIANRHGMTLASLLKANNLQVNSLIIPGQKLNVSTNPSSSQVVVRQATKLETKVEVVKQEEVSTESSATLSTSVESETFNTSQTTNEEQSNQSANEVVVSTGSYVVKANDTLYAIARRNGLNLNDLIEKNGGTTIYIGQVINF